MEARKLASATYADLEALPPNMVGEILGGDLYMSPRPAMPHARASSGLGGHVHGPFDRGTGGPGGWWIIYEPELAIDDDVAVPDLAGWRRSKLPKLPAVAQMTIVPDWVCEVVSPGTARLDRALKMPRYARWGVAHAWLVDPIARTLEVFRNEGGRWMVLGVWSGNATVEAEPFEAVPLMLGSLWIDEEEG